MKKRKNKRKVINRGKGTCPVKNQTTDFTLEKKRRKQKL